MTPKEFIRHALQNAKGDDLERATAAFRHMTEEQLDRPHGQSGYTRREIWDNYKKHRQEWNEANHYLEIITTNDAF